MSGQPDDLMLVYLRRIDGTVGRLDLADVPH